ncbi:MAG TPA: hypothetical protein PLN52_00905, partial [Opitutaceae bacterium]|nr:hypothetical protein [Opitutaceae bacterium]
RHIFPRGEMELAEWALSFLMRCVTWIADCHESMPPTISRRAARLTEDLGLVGHILGCCGMRSAFHFWDARNGQKETPQRKGWFAPIWDCLPSRTF